MRKYLLSSAFCGLCVLGIQAQVTLKGVAVKMNSDFTPVAGVEVVVQGGVPTLTDGAGTFMLKLPHMEPGDLLFDIRISKQGMEIVNLKEVEQWVASGDILSDFGIEIRIEYAFVIFANHQFAFRVIDIFVVQRVFLINVDFALRFTEFLT